jgi:hypothetical protein
MFRMNENQGLENFRMPNAMQARLVLGALLLLTGLARAQDPLATSFKTPPEAARPRVWCSVKNVADVRMNGRSVGTAWKAPFRVDVTDALKPGPNSLEIHVSNLWPNRLIGDKQPGVTRKYAFAVSDPYRADSPLLPSGLLGPVQFLRVTRPRTTATR